MSLVIAIVILTLGFYLVFILDNWLDERAWRLEDDDRIESPLFGSDRKEWR